MSIISKITDAARTKPADAFAALEAAEKIVVALEGQVAASAKELSRRDAQMGDAALDGDAAFEAADQAFDMVKRKHRRLEMALSAAKQRRNEAERAHKAEQNAALIRSISRKAAKRSEAAEKLSATLVEAVKHWRDLNAISADLFVSVPQVPGVLLTPDALVNALAIELFKLTGNAPVSGLDRGFPAFPAARCPDLSLLGLPEKLPSLVDQITQANDRLIEGVKAS